MTNENMGPQGEHFEVLAAASGGATRTSGDFFNQKARGVMLLLDVDTIAGGESITVSLELKDPVSGDYITLVTFTAVTSAADKLYTIYPGAVETITNANHEVQGLPLPTCIWRIKVTHSASGTHAYSVGAAYIW